MSTATPRILLIGAGNFGRQHLQEWLRLVEEKKAILAGVIVKTKTSCGRLEKETDYPVFTELSEELLQTVDGVDIASPADSHFELAKYCLKHTNILVEKPMTAEPAQALALQQMAEVEGNVLMVGHIYRFNPLVRKLKSLTDKLGNPPQQITGVLSNPLEPGSENLNPRLEFIHLFDIIDFLFGKPATFCIGVKRESIDRVSLRYPGPMNAVLDMGWCGNTRQRKLSLVYPDQQIDCDFSENTIVVNQGGDIRKTYLDHKPQALRNELCTFLDVINGGTEDFPGASVGRRMIEIATSSKPEFHRRRPKVAIIGGGIFGTTCAIELGQTCDVTVFERHRELMTEASFANQWRHHSGFHYPRSPQTVDEVKESRGAFVERYGGAVHFDIPCYYGTSAFGTEITAERYLGVCRANGLNFEITQPPAGIVDPDCISVCLKTDEGVLNYYALREQIESELQQEPNVRLLRETNVTSGKFGPQGEKILTFESNGEVQEGEFDFLVNTTYGNRNRAASWFNFQPAPIRFDLLELLVLEIDTPPVCMTILDAPFTSLTSMGYDNLFMLSHIYQSVSQSTVSMEEPSIDWANLPSNRENLLSHGLRYLPVLKNAKYVKSVFGLRAVYALSPDFDGRPTVVTDHGFGCWSVLGGKIITCVSNAREIADEIGRSQYGSETRNMMAATK